MSEIDAINERLNKADERFGRGEEKFSEFAGALADIKGHLKSQDQTMATMAAKLDTVVTGTDSIVGMWSGGVKTVRFFCRLAESWTFLLRKVFIPVVLPLVGIWALFRIANHQSLPDSIIAGIKLILATL
ncbi:hypothetical protein PQR71_42220 [Paraburkholderia fungorum]|uniref:hypothetical protein n=1 Tax=Paraburkholderia fungorum TaxID=134537 RepID=UPI0038BA2A9A